MILGILLTGCCKDEDVGRDLLTDYEEEIIQYNGYDDIEYINEEGQIGIAQSSTAKIARDIWRPGTESSSLWEYQTSTRHIIFRSEDFTLQIEIDKLLAGNFTINIGRGESYYFGQDCRIPLVQPIEQRVTNISIEDYEFTNVIVFENCSDFSEISKIFYSAENGIEYLEFLNGSFLKIN